MAGNKAVWLSYIPPNRRHSFWYFLSKRSAEVYHTKFFLTERKPFRVHRFLKESIKLFYFFVFSWEQTFDNREQCTCFRVDWRNHQTLFGWIFLVKPWKTDIAKKIYRNRWHWKSNRIYRDTCFQAFRKQLFHC